MPFFLSEQEAAAFSSFHIPRKVRAHPGHAAWGARAEPLAAMAMQWLTAFAARDALGFCHEALLVEAQDEDGLSWACEEIASTAAGSDSPWQVLALGRQIAEDGLPAIALLVPAKKLRRILTRSKLLSNAAEWALFRAWIYVFVALGLALLAYRLAPGGDPVTSWSALAVLVGTIGDLVIQHINLRRSEPDQPRLMERIQERAESPPYKNAVAHLASEVLQPDRPTLIVIDDFSLLDRFSQDVVREVLFSATPSYTGLLVWAITEPADKAELSRRLVLELGTDERLCEGKWRRAVLEPLTLQERREVLRVHGLAAARAQDHPIVKSLVHGYPAGELEAVDKMWRDFLGVESRESDFRTSVFLRLLAFDPYQPGLMLDERDLLSLFAAKDVAGRSPLAPAFLQALFGQPPLRLDTVRGYITDIRQRLGRLLANADAGAKGLRLTPLAARIVTESPHERLSAEDAHLFWLLVWARRLSTQFSSSAALRKMVHHATRAGLTPETLGGSRAQDVCNELFLDLDRLASACLHSTWTAQAVAVGESFLRNAETLLDSGVRLDTTVLEGLLPRACWEIAATTGHQAFLARFLRVANQISPEPPRADLGDAAIVGTYLRVIGLADGLAEASASAVERLAGRKPEMLVRLRLLALAGSADFLLPLIRFVPPGVVAASGLLSLESLVQRLGAVDPLVFERIYQDPERRFTVIDHTVLGSLLLALVECGARDQAEEALLAFALKALAVTTGAAAAPQRTLLERAFRLDALACCLDAELRMVKSGSAKVLYAIPEQGEGYGFAANIVPGTRAAAVAELARCVNTELGTDLPETVGTGAPLPVALLRGVGQLYLHAAMAWDEFGLEERRDVAFLRRAAYLFRFTNAEPMYPGTMEGLVRALSYAARPDDTSATAIVTLLYLAGFYAGVNELSSLYRANCAHRLLLSNRSDAFGAVALALCSGAHARSLPMEGVLQAAGERLEKAAFRELMIGALGAQEFVDRVVHRVLEHSRHSDQGLYERTVAWATPLSRDPAFGAGDDLALYLDFHALYLLPRRTGAGGSSSVLQAWGSRRDHWLYLAVLERLFEEGLRDDSFIEECVTLLEQAAPCASTPYYRLAFALTHHEFDRDSSTLLVRLARVLQDEVAPTLASWPTEAALETYDLLRKIDPRQAADHAYQLSYWTAIHLEKEHLTRFGDLLQRGHYFWVLETYFRALARFGVPVAVRDRAFCDTVERGSDVDATQLLASINEDSLQAMVETEHGGSVLLDFVFAGRLAFSLSLEVTPRVTSLRQRVDDLAREGLSRFLDVMSRADATPPGLRALIQEHRQALGDLSDGGDPAAPRARSARGTLLDTRGRPEAPPAGGRPV